MDSKKKSIEKIGFGIAIMFLISWIWAIFIRNKLNLTSIQNTIIGIIVLYVIGLCLFKLIVKNIPNYKIEKGKISLKELVLCFLLQFSSILVMSVLTVILSKITGNEIGGEIDALTPLMLFQLLIFNPIIEEYVFRKLFADKLLKHGELLFMLTSSFCFSIVHGVSLGIPQILYTFILGMIWSYVYIKSGNLLVPIILHSLSNLFGSVIIQSLQSVSQIAVSIHSMCIMLMGIVGIILFFSNKKKIKIDNDNKLITKLALKDIFFNKGILFYIIITITMFIFKNI